MLWLILIVFLVNLVLVVAVAWSLRRELQRHQQRVTTVIETLNQTLPQEMTISPLMEPGSSFLPSDQEAAAVESRMLHDSAQRAGSLRSRRNSTRMRG